MGGGQKPQKPAIMNRSSEACHSWQTGRSQPGGWGLHSAAPETPSVCFSHHPHPGWRLPQRAAWMPHPTCRQTKKAWLSPSPDNARKTSRGHQSPLQRQYFPPILSCLSCPPWPPKALLSHTSSSSFPPHKDGEPREEVLFAKHLSWWPRAFPWW